MGLEVVVDGRTPVDCTLTRVKCDIPLSDDIGGPVEKKPQKPAPVYRLPGESGVNAQISLRLHAPAPPQYHDARQPEPLHYVVMDIAGDYAL